MLHLLSTILPVAAPFHAPANSARGSSLATSLPHLLFSVVLRGSMLAGERRQLAPLSTCISLRVSAAEPLCGFNHPHVFFGEMASQARCIVLTQAFRSLLSFRSFLCILDVTHCQEVMCESLLSSWATPFYTLTARGRVHEQRVELCIISLYVLSCLPPAVLRGTWMLMHSARRL